MEPNEKTKGLAGLTAEKLLVVMRGQVKDYLDAGGGAFYELPPERFIFRTNAWLKASAEIYEG